jgi:hypothetical protein
MQVPCQVAIVPIRHLTNFYASNGRLHLNELSVFPARRGHTENCRYRLTLSAMLMPGHIGLHK